MRGIKAMKRILLRTLKEIGRLALIIIVPILFTFIFTMWCEPRICHNGCASYWLHCFKIARIVFLSILVIMGVILFILIRLKKLSKLWLIEGIALYLISQIVVQILDYRSAIEPQNMISEKEQQHIIIERE